MFWLLILSASPSPFCGRGSTHFFSSAAGFQNIWYQVSAVVVDLQNIFKIFDAGNQKHFQYIWQCWGKISPDSENHLRCEMSISWAIHWRWKVGFLKAIFFHRSSMLSRYLLAQCIVFWRSGLHWLSLPYIYLRGKYFVVILTFKSRTAPF